MNVPNVNEKPVTVLRSIGLVLPRRQKTKERLKWEAQYSLAKSLWNAARYHYQKKLKLKRCPFNAEWCEIPQYHREGWMAIASLVQKKLKPLKKRKWQNS